jgi:hypothetical protein
MFYAAPLDDPHGLDQRRLARSIGQQVCRPSDPEAGVIAQGRALDDF